MNFIPVDEIPKKNSGRVNAMEHKSVYNYLMEFMKMNIKYARISFTPADYSDIYSAADSIRTAISRCGASAKVVIRGDDVYLMRTDMEVK